MRQRTVPPVERAWPRLLLAAAVALGLGLGPAASPAEAGKGEYLGAWSIAGSLGYAVPNTDEYDNAVAWRIAGGYSPAPQLEFDLEVGRYSSVVSQPDAGGLPSHTIASGELGVRPVCLTLQYRRPLPEALSTLVVLGGFGYYFVDYDMDAAPRAALGDAGAQHVDNAWGFHVGLGLEYALTERISLAAETRYVFLSPQAGGASSADTEFDGELDLNTWIFGGGLKVVF